MYVQVMYIYGRFLRPWQFRFVMCFLEVDVLFSTRLDIAPLKATTVTTPIFDDNSASFFRG